MIKNLNKNDLDEFIRLRMAGLKSDPEAFGAAFEEGIDREKTLRDLKAKNEENFILGYFEQDELLGMVGFVRKWRIKARHIGFIWGMYVAENARGKGIGKKLMEACISQAESLPGLEKITLEVTETQMAAKKLYEDMGFVIYGIEKNSMHVNGKSIVSFHMNLHF